MRIVVLGAGTVGMSVADLLCQQRHSVTVVDKDAAHCRAINDELDVRTVTGSASHASVLFQADVIGSDICLAVTGDDEVNMVAASMAKSLGARRSIARVYAPVFRDLSTFDYQRHFNIDRMLSLEQLSAMELARGIRSAGSVMLESFARGELEVLELEVDERAAAVGKSLKQLALPQGMRVGSIYRDDRMWIAGADDVVEVGDRVTVIGKRGDVGHVRSQFHTSALPRRRVVIAGGGEVGYHLAATLEEQHSVMLMEADASRCQVLAATLRHATVVNADATRRAVLEEERVGTADVFVAATGDDENNIMACVEAREIGAKQIMAIIGRPDYANVVGKLGIDLAVSERNVMARQILGFLNTGQIISRANLPGGRIGVFEIEVPAGAPATRHVLAKTPFPAKCLLAAVCCKNYVRVPGADDRLEPGDTVVLLIDDSVADDVLALFKP